mgnify:CR=1 FL=1
MRNLRSNIKEKLVAKYLVKDQPIPQAKSTDINILLNRIELNKKNESKRKLYFSAIASTGLILFGLIIF